MEVIDDDDRGGSWVYRFFWGGFCFLFRGIAVLGMWQCERHSRHHWDWEASFGRRNGVRKGWRKGER